MPALPLDDAGPYVAGAYLVFLALVLIYVAIMAARLARVQRDIEELEQTVDARGKARDDEEAAAAADAAREEVRTP